MIGCNQSWKRSEGVEVGFASKRQRRCVRQQPLVMRWLLGYSTVYAYSFHSMHLHAMMPEKLWSLIMSWDRNTSTSEQLMVEVLEDAKQALTLDEIVSAMQNRDPSVLTGKTPTKSLYSVVYRREKRRAERGLEALFTTTTRGGSTYYSLNPEGMETAGERILEK